MQRQTVGRSALSGRIVCTKKRRLLNDNHLYKLQNGACMNLILLVTLYYYEQKIHN